MGKYSKTTKTTPGSTQHLKQLCSSHLSNKDCAYYQIIMLGKKNKYVDTENFIQDLKLCPIQNLDLPRSPIQQIYTLLKVLPEKYKRGLLISCLNNEPDVILSTMIIELDKNSDYRIFEDEKIIPQIEFDLNKHVIDGFDWQCS